MRLPSNKTIFLNFLIIFTFLILLWAFINMMYFFYDFDKPLFISMETFSIAWPIYPQVKLNVYGFFVPMIFSVLALLYLIKTKTNLPYLWLLILPLIWISGTAIFSYFVTNIVLKLNGGGGISPPALVVALIPPLYLFSQNRNRIAMTLGYILSYISCVASDIGVLPYLGMKGTFGGRGLFDGDFIIPLSFFLSIAIYSLFKMNKTES